MSSEWKTSSLLEHYDVRSGLSKPAKDFGSGHPFLSFKDVFYNFFVPPKLGDLVNSTDKEREACSVVRGDVFLTRTSETMHELGMSSVALQDYPNATFNGFCKRLRPKVESDLVPEFVGYYLRSPQFRQVMLSFSTMSTRASLNNEMIGRLTITYPPMDEQRRISSILKSLDDRIALLRETNTTLEAIAQALFKSWFVDFDPVHANTGTQAASLPTEIQALFPSRLVESPQGLIPEGWEWGAISDYAELNPESWTVKKHPETVAYIDLANAKDNVIADIAEFVFADAPSRARRVLRNGDTIVGTVRPGNRSFAFIYDAASNLTGSTGFAVLRPKHPRNTAFIYLAATNDSSIDHLAHVADGGAYPAVRPDVVAGLTCVRAPADVLEAFNEVSEELLCKISKNHSLAQTLSDLRDTLLPRLISGQLRLPEAEAALAEVG